jgi:hypothetical protein
MLAELTYNDWTVPPRQHSSANSEQSCGLWFIQITVNRSDSKESEGMVINNDEFKRTWKEVNSGTFQGNILVLTRTAESWLRF